MSSRSAAAAEAPPKGGKRARTRAALLAAAVDLFREKGLLAVSLDEVAARAGLTKGAIYGNFRNKDDLICAVALERGRRPRPIFGDEAPIADQFDALVASVGAPTPAALNHLRFLTELDLYVLTHADARERMFSLARERYRQAADNLARIADPESLPLPPLEFAIVTHALYNGLLYQRGIWPEVVTDKVMRAAFAALSEVRPRSPAPKQPKKKPKKKA